MRVKEIKDIDGFFLTDCTLVYGPLPCFDTKKAERPKAFRKKVYFRSQSGICLACS